MSAGINVEDEIEATIELMIAKLQDAEGNPVFENNPDTRVALQSEVDAKVLDRILASFGSLPAEDEVKNA